MSARRNTVTFEGKNVTLIGSTIEKRQHAPDFIASDLGFGPVVFSSIMQGPCVLSSVVSLATPVCQKQARRLERAASNMGPAVDFFLISMDLPFAMSRWCEREEITHLTFFSDHRDASFGTSYGVLIKEKRLLARSIFVLDGEHIVRHCEVVPEITEEPDYQAALKALREITED